MPTAATKTFNAKNLDDGDDDEIDDSPTLLDRSIDTETVVLVNRHRSRRCSSSISRGDEEEVEKVHRLHGTAVLAEAWQLLLVPQRQPSPEGGEEKEDGDERQQQTTAKSATTEGNEATEKDGSQRQREQQEQQQRQQQLEVHAAGCYATSCSIFHRYYSGASLRRTNAWSAAMACAFVASKLHQQLDQPVTAQRVVLVFAHLYAKRCRRRRRRKGGGTAATAASKSQLVSPTTTASRSCPTWLGRLSPFGPVYKEWYDALIETETDVLRRLGFVLYWIPQRLLVHKFLLPFLETIFESRRAEDGGGGGGNSNSDENGTSFSNRTAAERQCDAISQRAWEYCNDSYRFDLLTRYEPHVVACAAIHLALLDCCSRYSPDGNVRNDGISDYYSDNDRRINRAWWWVPLCCCCNGHSDGNVAAQGNGKNKVERKRKREKQRTAPTAKVNNHDVRENNKQEEVARDIAAICNAILGLQRKLRELAENQKGDDDASGRGNNVEGSGTISTGSDITGSIWQAEYGFVPSLEAGGEGGGGSFNDPGSFVWETMAVGGDDDDDGEAAEE